MRLGFGRYVFHPRPGAAYQFCARVAMETAEEHIRFGNMLRLLEAEFGAENVDWWWNIQRADCAHVVYFIDRLEATRFLLQAA